MAKIVVFALLAGVLVAGAHVQMESVKVGNIANVNVGPDGNTTVVAAGTITTGSIAVQGPAAEAKKNANAAVKANVGGAVKSTTAAKPEKTTTAKPGKAPAAIHPDVAALQLLAQSLDPTHAAHLLSSRNNTVAWWCDKLWQYQLSGNSTMSGSCHHPFGGKVLGFTSLRLSRNGSVTAASLGGTLPANLPPGALHRLEDLAISGQGIKGTLPPWVLTLPDLRSLSVESTSMLGPLPEWNQRSYALSFQQAKDEASSMATNLAASDDDIFDLMNAITIQNTETVGPGNIKITQNTLLSGPLPSSWANVTGLYEMDLHGNALTGTIPATWATMSCWIHSLDLSNNNLHGTLTQEWSNVASLMSRIPISLESVDLSNNRGLGGCVPAFWAKIYGIFYSGLNINGTGLKVCADTQQPIENLYNAPIPGWSPATCRLQGYTLKPQQLPTELSHEGRVRLYVIHTALYGNLSLDYAVPLATLSATAAACDAEPNCVMFTSDGFLLGAYRHSINASQLHAASVLERKGWVAWQHMAYCSGTCCGTYVVDGLDLSVQQQDNISAQQPEMEVPGTEADARAGSGPYIELQDAADMCNEIQKWNVSSSHSVLPGYPAAVVVTDTSLLFNCPQRCKVGCCDMIRRHNGQKKSFEFPHVDFEQCNDIYCQACGFPWFQQLAGNVYGRIVVYPICVKHKGPCGSPKLHKKVPCVEGVLC